MEKDDLSTVDAAVRYRPMHGIKCTVSNLVAAHGFMLTRSLDLYIIKLLGDIGENIFDDYLDIGSAVAYTRTALMTFLMK